MQQEKIYVIRHLSYWYNDEYYSASLSKHWHHGHITNIFKNKDQAIEQWKKLEHAFSQLAKFENILYCENSTGEFDGKQNLLAQKSPDELFEIIEKWDCHVYALYEYPKQLKQYVFFNAEQQEYETSYDTDEYDLKSNTSISAGFIDNDPLLDQITPSTECAINRDIEYVGSLEEFSDTPLLLKTLIENDPDLSFSGSCLTITPNGITKINPLLKPEFRRELKFLSLEEIYQLEKPLN